MLWPLTGGRRPPLRCPGSHLRALGAAWRIGGVDSGASSCPDRAHERWVPRAARCGSGRARAISAARLRLSPAFLAPAVYRPGSLPGPLPEGELIPGTASRLDAFSGYPRRTRLPGRAVGRQPVHRRCVHPGPLVLGAASIDSPAPTEDRDRTVSRRSEPSSRTALNGEQPYPWDLLQPQDAMSRHRGAKPCRRCGLLGKISLLSPEYLLSVERRPTHSGPPDH